MEKEQSIAFGIVTAVAIVAIVGLFIPSFSFDGNMTGEAIRLGSQDIECSDEDGADLHRKTMVQFGRKKIWDQCGTSLGVVVEAVCDERGRAVRVNMECPKNEVCNEGACVPETMTRPGRIARDACFDPDAGNLFVRTEVSTDKERLLDQCMSVAIIQEATCGMNGKPSYALAGCPGGYTCRSGACQEIKGDVIQG